MSNIPPNLNSKSGFRRKTMIMIIAAVFSVALIATSCKENENDGDGTVTVPYTTKIETTPATTTEETDPVLPLLPGVEERLAVNTDSAGWIYIPDVVDEEIVQRTDKETGNEFYVYHDINGNKYEGGVIFADFRNILNGRKTSDNIILYGHNQKDNSRFGDLDKYKWNKNYYKTHPLITFSTNYVTRKYKIISVFITNVNPEDDNGNVFDYHNYIEFDEDRYNDFIENVSKRSLIITGTDCQFGDRFITLSTCSTEFDPSRLVIVGREVREGESEDVDLSKFQINPNPKYPAVIYKYQGGTYVD